jgi:membrane protease YdiL (CAAX protease family)
MILSSNWRLALLQVTLGPVLEEVVFRGYLFSLLTGHCAERQVRLY